MNCQDVTLKSIKSHLYHVVCLSICECFFYFPFLLIISLVFYALSVSAVYMYVCYVLQ